MVKEEIQGMVGEIEVQSASKCEQIEQRKSNYEREKKDEKIIKLIENLIAKVDDLNKKLDEVD